MRENILLNVGKNRNGLNDVPKSLVIEFPIG